MRCRLFLLSAGIALATLPVLAAAGDDTKALDLATFEFKVPKGKEALFSYNTGEEKLCFYTNGTAEGKVKIAKDGDYEITVKASGEIALKVGAKFKLSVDGKQLGKETETVDDAKEYKFATPLKAGERTLSIAFTNDVYKEGEYDRNLYLHGVTIKKVQ
jgi:hypothetical protein